MGVDYFPCDNCKQVVNDCMSNEDCVVCNNTICENCTERVRTRFVFDKYNYLYQPK